MSYPANDNKADILYPNPNPTSPYNPPSPYYPPVTMQPGVSGGSVMVINNNNNQSQRFAKRPWTHGLCDCFGDIGGCLCAWCFPLCYKYSISEAMGEGCCTCCFAGLGAMRAKIRAERGIQGEVWEDECAAACCPLCVMVQMARELKETQPLI